MYTYILQIFFVYELFMLNLETLMQLNDKFDPQIFEININKITQFNKTLKQELNNYKDLGSYSYIYDHGLDSTLIINGIQLSSRYDRVAFTKYKCRNLILKENIFIYGFGIGDEVFYLSSLTKADIYVIILNPNIFYELLGRLVNLHKVLNTKIHFIIPKENFPYSENSVINTSDLYIEQEVFNNLKQKLINTLDDKFIGNDVNNKLWDTEKKLIQNNYEMLKHFEYLTLKDVTNLKNQIAVVAPGPSLKKNIKKLDKIRAYTSIIVVDVALKYILDNGIIPDIVVTLDAKMSIDKIGDINKYYELLNNSLLIFSPCTSPAVLQAFSGEKKFIYQEKHLKLLSYLPYDNAGFVKSYGSVLNQSVEIAIKRQPVKILLFGVDFAFLDEETHVGRKDGKNLFLPMEKIKIKCNDGKIRDTVKPFSNYRTILEKTIRNNPQTEFDNYSITGAVIQGTNVVYD